MKVPLVQSRNVLVTGCSSGIGAATAATLHQQGWNVAASARKPGDIERLREEGYTAVRMDMADEQSVGHAAEEVLSLFKGRIGAVVNNAGFGQPGAIEDLDRAAMRYQFEVNVFGLQQLTNFFIPIMRKQGWGRIVNVSSVLGRISLPFMGIYSASKYALESMSDALRVELRGTGVAVSLIEPGPIKTQFSQNAVARGSAALDFDGSRFGEGYRKHMDRRRDDNQREPFTLPPEAVASKIIHAIESSHPRRRYGVTMLAYFIAMTRRFAPDSFTDYLMWRHMSQRHG